MFHVSQLPSMYVTPGNSIENKVCCCGLDKSAIVLRLEIMHTTTYEPPSNMLSSAEDHHLQLSLLLPPVYLSAPL